MKDGTRLDLIIPTVPKRFQVGGFESRRLLNVRLITLLYVDFRLLNQETEYVKMLEPVIAFPRVGHVAEESPVEAQTILLY